MAKILKERSYIPNKEAWAPKTLTTPLYGINHKCPHLDSFVENLTNVGNEKCLQQIPTVN